MKKQGPCCHCGIKSTPLWRNGPPGKPVLCNACGSRWRTKGTLANYFPQHALRFSPSDSEDSGDSGEYELPCKRKTKSLHKINQNGDDVEVGEITSGYHHTTSFEDNMSNRSSSGSGLSFSDNMSSVQLASTDGKDISAFCPEGSELLFLKEPNIPSRKRTSFECHSPSPVEKLRRELVSILQEQESSCPSQFSEEVLLFENQDPTVSVETSLGSLLIKHPVTSVEESQASSLTKENEASYLNDSSMVSSSVQAPFQGCEVSSSLGDDDRMRRNLGEEKGINEPAAKRRAVASLFLESSPCDHPYIMTMPRNCSCTDILLQNVSTARLPVARPLKERAPMMKPLASMRPLSSMDPTILAPGRDSVVPNPVKAMSIKPFCEVSLTSSDASSLLQAPFEMERLCRMNRPK